MKFHILTLFPEMVRQGLDNSIIGRAAGKQIIEINTVNIRDYTMDRHGKVDDYPYGGGAGMLMQAQPVYDAWKTVTGEGGERLRTIYVTPQGVPFTQRKAEELSREKELIFLCGHYEGIDERVLDEIVTDYISIGDYVLTGGELPAMVMVDAIARLIPGVLNNAFSAETESFHNDLLEYPQYSRPEIWHDKKVPPVLLSGDHRRVTEWRLQQAKERTKRLRPDLYEKYICKMQAVEQLSARKRIHIHMMENLRRGKGELLYASGDDILLYDRESSAYMITAQDRTGAGKMLEILPEDAGLFVAVQQFVCDLLRESGRVTDGCKCYQACYTLKEPLPVRHKDIRRLDESHLGYLKENYSDNEEYLRKHLRAGELFGAFVEDKLVGFVGIHSEGSFGMLFVEEAYRGRGIAASLESYVINLQKSMGWIPYCNVVEGNEASLKLQRKLGLYIAKEWLWWLW